MLIGGALALLCDDLSRSIRAGEIPLGIVTSLIGSAIFIVMFLRNNVGGR
jgi:iron complex transport system permease protein